MATGGRFRSSGLSSPGTRVSGVYVIGLIVASVAIGFVGSRSKSLASFYPYAESLAQLVTRWGWWVFAAHALGYLVLFYLPWEFLLRGLLILPFVEEAEIGTKRPSGAALGIACLQAIPSSLLHFGHPLTESLLAVPFGAFLGWLVLRTGSVLPGLLLHAASGIALDFFIVLSGSAG